MEGKLDWSNLDTIFEYIGVKDYEVCIDQILAIIEYQKEIRELENVTNIG